MPISPDETIEAHPVQAWQPKTDQRDRKRSVRLPNCRHGKSAAVALFGTAEPWELSIQGRDGLRGRFLRPLGRGCDGSHGLRLGALAEMPVARTGAASAGADAAQSLGGLVKK